MLYLILHFRILVRVNQNPGFSGSIRARRTGPRDRKSLLGLVRMLVRGDARGGDLCLRRRCSGLRRYLGRSSGGVGRERREISLDAEVKDHVPTGLLSGACCSRRDGRAGRATALERRADSERRN